MPTTESAERKTRRGDYVLAKLETHEPTGEGDAMEKVTSYEVVVVKKASKDGEVTSLIHASDYVPGGAKSEVEGFDNFTKVWDLPAETRSALAEVDDYEIGERFTAPALDEARKLLKDLTKEYTTKAEAEAEAARAEGKGKPERQIEIHEETGRPVDGRDIKCDECGAEVGKACKYPSGFIYSKSHTSRRPGETTRRRKEVETHEATGRPVDGRDIECPECSAPAGQACKYPSGHFYSKSHAVRRPVDPKPEGEAEEAEATETEEEEDAQ